MSAPFSGFVSSIMGAPYMITRRAFVLLGVAAGSALRLRAQAPAISAADFLRFSQRLTGRSTLDPDAAALYFKALTADAATAPLLARLVTGSGGDLTPAHLALERTILEWWYTGVYTVRGEPRLATHAGALVWSAMGMPAPGTCAAPFGAWARPPRV